MDDFVAECLVDSGFRFKFALVNQADNDYKKINLLKNYNYGLCNWRQLRRMWHLPERLPY